MTTVEIGLTTIISVLALALSAYSVTVAKKRGDSADLKELTTALATMTTKLETIEKSVLGSPTLSEQALLNAQKISEHDRRITALEQRTAQGNRNHN